MAYEPGPPVFRSSRLGLLGKKKRAAKDAFSKLDALGQDEADEFLSRIAHGYRYQRLSYQRPQFNGNWQVFSDLLAYAPGLNTSYADIQAVLEAEAQPNPRTAPGRIDEQARKLIEK